MFLIIVIKSLPSNEQSRQVASSRKSFYQVRYFNKVQRGIENLTKLLKNRLQREAAMRRIKCIQKFPHNLCIKCHFFEMRTNNSLLIEISNPTNFTKVRYHCWETMIRVIDGGQFKADLLPTVRLVWSLKRVHRNERASIDAIQLDGKLSVHFESTGYRRDVASSLRSELFQEHFAFDEPWISNEKYTHRCCYWTKREKNIPRIFSRINIPFLSTKGDPQNDG